MSRSCLDNSEKRIIFSLFFHQQSTERYQMKALSCIREHTSCKMYKPCSSFAFKKHHLFPSYVFENKCQEDNQFLFVATGSLEIRINHHEPLRIERNQFILIPVSSSYKLEITEECVLVTMTFREVSNLCKTFSLDSLKKHAAQHSGILTALDMTDSIRIFLESIMDYLEKQVYCSDLHNLKQNELFYLLRYGYTRDQLVSVFYPLLADDKGFKTLVMENFRSSRSTTELAERCGFSTSSFNRKFKTEFGCTPYKWLQKEMSKEILYELSVNKVSFSEIVYRFGFTSSSHFNAFCKKEFGMTPTELKHKIKE